MKHIIYILIIVLSKAFTAGAQNDVGNYSDTIDLCDFLISAYKSEGKHLIKDRGGRFDTQIDTIYQLYNVVVTNTLNGFNESLEKKLKKR